MQSNVDLLGQLNAERQKRMRLQKTEVECQQNMSDIIDQQRDHEDQILSSRLSKESDEIQLKNAEYEAACELVAAEQTAFD
mgnify:CR=1 FL=1